MGDTTNKHKFTANRQILTARSHVLITKSSSLPVCPLKAQNFFIKTEIYMNQLEPRAGISRGYHRKKDDWGEDEEVEKHLAYTRCFLKWATSSVYHVLGQLWC